MPRVFLLFFLVLLLASGQGTQAQITGTILDKITGLPIPYASIWLEQEDKGISAEANGTFQLKAPGRQNRNLVITAAGYEKSLVPASSQHLQVFLNPRPAAFPKKPQNNPANTRKKTTGSLAWSRLKTNYYGNDGHPYVLARFFPYDSAYAQTPFIHAISFYTRSRLPQASFQLRLFAADAQGKPGEDLLPGGLVIRVEKGQHLNTAHLSHFQLPMPENGLFIGFEWLIIETNKYAYGYTRPGGKKQHKAISYEPNLGVTEEAGFERWMYLRGAWRRSSDQKQEMNTKLLFQLSLTD